MRLFLSFIFSILFSYDIPASFAHAGHSSLLEIEEIQEANGQRRLEVTWELERQDLELQLAMQSDQHVVFNAGNSFHDLLLPWLQQNFRLQQGVTPNSFHEMTTSPAHQNRNFQFSLLGKELGAKRMLIFFSVQILSGTTAPQHEIQKTRREHLWLQVPALLFLDENYVNLVNARACSAHKIKKNSLRFDRTHLDPKMLPFCS